MPAEKPKVLLAMSGGVDSSVAAALLLREGYDVVGVFMRLGSPGETLDELVPDEVARRSASCTPGSESRATRIGHQGCCSINDAADARMVAGRLGIPFYVVNFKKDFGRIIDYFVGEYNAGRTPNPCIRCNDWLKFGKLHDYARQIDADFVASGHYARVQVARHSESGELPQNDGTEVPYSRGGASNHQDHARLGASGHQGHRLLRGLDHDKDQSYVLFGVPRDRLAHMLLPIGGYRKAEVRRLAQELELPVFDKPDSQEICFVPDNDYAGLVRRRTPEAVRPGDLLTTSGRVIGQHDGHQHFTIGQRRGLGVAVGHPLYVIGKDAASNTVIVGEKDDLVAAGCLARESNWLIDPPNRDWLTCTAKIRYNAEPVAGRVRAVDEADLEVRFDEPQHAVAPGQAVVCYDADDAVICGGWIDQAL